MITVEVRMRITVPPNNRNSPKFIIGVFLVLMGVVLALDQLGLVQANHLLRFWPAALILVGLVMLQRGERHSALRALVLIVAGGWLLLNTLDLVSLDIWEFLWPLLLVFFGARIMMRNQGYRSGAPQDLRRPPHLASSCRQRATTFFGVSASLVAAAVSFSHCARKSGAVERHFFSSSGGKGTKVPPCDLMLATAFVSKSPTQVR